MPTGRRQGGEGWEWGGLAPVSPVLNGRQKLRALTCLPAAPAALRGGADGASPTPTFLESSSPTLCRASSSCLQDRKDKLLEAAGESPGPQKSHFLRTHSHARQGGVVRKREGSSLPEGPEIYREGFFLIFIFHVQGVGSQPQIRMKPGTF